MKKPHNLTTNRKEQLFNQFFPLIYMIYTLGNSMIIRSQIRKLYFLLGNKNSIHTDFAIAELISYGFLFQKKICKDSLTSMLYLNKYCIGKLQNKPSKNIPAIYFSNQKIFESIFKAEFLIEIIIPEMKMQNFKIDTDNIIMYLTFNGTNLLLRPNQFNTYTFYNQFLSVASQTCNLKEEFYTDMNIALCEKQLFMRDRLKIDTLENIPFQNEKHIRDSIRNSYTSDLERRKNSYTFFNLMSQRFFITHIKSEIHIVYFDCLNTLKLDKLYLNLIYALLMFQRYLESNVQLQVTVYTWNIERSMELQKAEIREVFDISRQEYKKTNRRDTYFSNLGIRKQYFDSINVIYKTMDIGKYNVHI